MPSKKVKWFRFEVNACSPVLQVAKAHPRKAQLGRDSYRPGPEGDAPADGKSSAKPALKFRWVVCLVRGNGFCDSRRVQIGCHLGGHVHVLKRRPRVEEWIRPRERESVLQQQREVPEFTRALV